jgi:predicted MFS family arabinose efflux permease
MRSPAATVTAAVLAVIACAFPGLLVGGLAGEIQDDLGISGYTLGLAVAVFWLAAAAPSARAGRFVDRFGPGRGIQLAGSLAALGALGAAVAPTPAALLAALAVGGSANALATPGVSALASQAIRPERQGLALGVQLAGPAVAALLAGLALPLLTQPVGWRPTFAAAAILALGAVAVAPRAAGERPPADQRSGDHPVTPLLAFAVGAAAANAAAGALLTFLVIYSVEIGLSGGIAGTLLAAAGGGAVAVRLGLGALADRRPNTRLSRVIELLLALGAIGYALLTNHTPALLAAGAIGAISFAWGWPGLLLLAVVRRYPSDPGAAVGIVATGFFAGAVLGPLLAGLIAERTSFELLWWSCATLALLAAAAIHAGDHILTAGGESTHSQPSPDP